jgi:hypothetical protein
MSEFNSLLGLFVDCYECDPNLLGYFLRQASAAIAETHKEPRFEDIEKALRASRKRTAQTVEKRILDIFGESINVQNQPSGGRFSEDPAAWDPITWDEYYQELAGELKAAIIAKCGPEFAESFSSLSDEVLASVGEEPPFSEIWAKYKFSQLAKTNVQVFLARRFAQWVDGAAAQIETLEDVEFRRSMPEHLRKYLGEAYRCYLLGLDAACAALCGAILQEALRLKLGVDRFGGLGKAIEAATRDGLLTHSASKAADEVRKIRNDAAHGNHKYAIRREHERKYVLSVTREVLDTIFAGGSDN